MPITMQRYKYLQCPTAETNDEHTLNFKDTISSVISISLLQRHLLCVSIVSLTRHFKRLINMVHSSSPTHIISLKTFLHHFVFTNFCPCTRIWVFFQVIKSVIIIFIRNYIISIFSILLFDWTDMMLYCSSSCDKVITISLILKSTANEAKFGLCGKYFVFYYISNTRHFKWYGY